MQHRDMNDIPMKKELTAAEHQILIMLADGVQQRVMRDRFKLSEYAMWTTLGRMRRKLGALNSLHMVKIACKTNLI